MNLLAQLLHPLQTAEFLSLYEINQPFVIHHQEQELKELRDLPFLASLDELLTYWNGPISAHLPDARDEVSAIEVRSGDAKKLFRNGMGLLFNDANLCSPLLQTWVEDLKRELGLSQITYGRSLIYATPDGQGTAPHFDQNINFVLQIQGTKIWNLAPNHCVINPMVRHTLGQDIDPEMMSYLNEPMPEQMPEGTLSFELKPGSMLFVPRGVWHSTQAQGDALALNFTFSPPTWADLFLAALRSRLLMEPEWRETADGVSDPERRLQGEQKFDLLLSSLMAEMPQWQARDILDLSEGTANE